MLDRLVPYLGYLERWNLPPSVVDRESMIRMRVLLWMAGVADEVKESQMAQNRTVGW